MALETVFEIGDLVQIGPYRVAGLVLGPNDDNGHDISYVVQFLQLRGKPNYGTAAASAMRKCALSFAGFVRVPR